MATTTKQNETWATKKYREFHTKYTQEKEAHNQTRKELKEAQDVIAVLTQENAELGKINQDLINRFVNGGIVYTEKDGFVEKAIRIPENSKWTFDQEIPSVLNTSLYRTFPFVVVENGQLRIDEKAHKKYKGVLL